MNKELRSAAQLVEKIKQDPDLQNNIKADPLGTLEAVSNEILQIPPVYFKDKWLYRIAVGTLAFVVISIVVGAFVIAGMEKNVPEIIVAIGSAATGGIVALFAPSPLQQ